MNLKELMNQTSFWVYEKGVLIKTDDPLRWGMNLQNGGNQIWATNVNGHRVSTICLGMDTAFGSTRYPVILETAINGSPVAKYCFLSDAKKAHFKIVREIARGELDDLLHETLDYDASDNEAEEQREGENGTP